MRATKFVFKRLAVPSCQLGDVSLMVHSMEASFLLRTLQRGFQSDNGIRICS